MFLYIHKHKNTAKFFLFFGFSVQKWSAKKDDTEINRHHLYNHIFFVK